MSLIAASAIGGAASLTGGLLANHNNRQMSTQQRKHELDMWNMTNAYNSPAQQMNRLKEAGLSPHLVQGGSDHANPPIQSKDDPEINPLDMLLPYLQQISQLQGAAQERKESDARIGNINQQTANATLVPVQHELDKIQREFENRMRTLDHKLNRARLNNDKTLMTNTVETMQYQRRKISAEIDNMIQSTALQLRAAGLNERYVNEQMRLMRQQHRHGADLHEYNVRHRRAETFIREYEASDDYRQMMRRLTEAQTSFNDTRSHGYLGGMMSGMWKFLDSKRLPKFRASDWIDNDFKK